MKPFLFSFVSLFSFRYTKKWVVMAPLAPQFHQPCKGSHLSNNCHVVTDAIARKEFLRNGDRCFLCLGQGHIGKNCQKSKRCFYCKGSHNSAICENKITKNYVAENSQINSSTNYSANSSCVLLQTAEIILANLVNKREIKMKTLFDQESQRSYH